MNRIFYGMIVIAFLFAGAREIAWSPGAVVRAQEAQVARMVEGVDLPPKLAQRVEALRADLDRQLDDRPAVIETLSAWMPSVEWTPPAHVDGVAPVSPMGSVSASLFGAVKASVSLAIGLVGAMAFFLGLMKVAEAGGMLAVVARAIRPVMEVLFPEVPADHPAMGAMIMNMSANALGLGNAATPFGIKAMQELDTLNPEKGTASNSMALFLAINTSSVTLLPTGVIALRDAAGSNDPAAIMGTTLFATICSSTAGICAAKLYQRTSPDPAGEAPRRSFSMAQGLVLVAYATLFTTLVTATVLLGPALSPWVVPLIVVGFLSWGFFAGVPVYEQFVEGAKDGFAVATKIIPYLVAILGAVGMLRGAGVIDAFSDLVGGFTTRVGMPAEALPMALLRPLSGSGAYGVMTDILTAEGPDTYAGLLVSTLQGSTETTFYVIAVYFGAVQVTKIRHTMWAALTADFVGIVAAIIACQLYMGWIG